MATNGSGEFLTRDQILKSDDLKYEDHDVPEWGGKVRVRELTAFDRERFEKRVGAAGNNPAGISKSLGDLRASLVASCLRNPQTNERLFADADVKALNEKSSLVISRLFTICTRISGISQEVVDAATGESEAITEGVSS